MDESKKIEVVELPVSELKDALGNPRTISAKKKNELKDSLDKLGDWGVIVIDDKNNIISGHQRVDALRASKGDDVKVLCKRLVGYSNAELRAINIMANTHAGEWDLSKLAEWTADLNIKLGLELPQKDATDMKINEMELIRYEKYDYVMICFRNEIDYLNFTRMIGIEDKKVLICKKKNGDRKIKARAIWYEFLKSKVDIKEKKEQNGA